MLLLLCFQVFLKLSAHGLQTLADGAVGLVTELVGNLFLRLAFLAQGKQDAVSAYYTKPKLKTQLPFLLFENRLIYLFQGIVLFGQFVFSFVV